ncbi:hypothetical protein HJFPF1_06699 [Paramyrothecium foliicola]|nr:hypothetical protein HJFPF1_06699 [Paramyrothecium foliicola]
MVVILTMQGASKPKTPKPEPKSEPDPDPELDCLAASGWLSCHGRLRALGLGLENLTLKLRIAGVKERGKPRQMLSAATRCILNLTPFCTPAWVARAPSPPAQPPTGMNGTSFAFPARNPSDETPLLVPASPGDYRSFEATEKGTEGNPGTELVSIARLEAMQSTAGYLTPGLLPLAHGSDAFFDDLSTQMAVSQATRRLSRGAGGQRAGSAMRVSKPSSASNSPRNSTALNRRRTMMNDAYMPPRQQQISDYFSTAQSKPSRPVSWHPSTHLQPMASQYQQTSYPLSTPSMYADHQDMYTSQPHFSPMMASYSNNTSPASNFSPLPLMYQGASSAQYGSESWGVPSKSTAYYSTQQDGQSVPGQEQFPSFGNAVHGSAVQTSTDDWNAFILHGFNNTSPPTPDSFLPPHQLQPTVTTVSQGYQDLEEPEEEGEILVGMGLYDPPEKYHEDPHLNNYRSTVSSLLGSTFRPKEPQGKGLKLEETWEPPKSDDEDDGEDAEDAQDDESDE